MAELFSFLNQITELSSTNLTIREATRTDQNPLLLRYRSIFPRVNAPSVRLSFITTVDFRPLGGRREWNAQGREIPEKLGPTGNFEMVPINPTHHIDERMLQLFGESGFEELRRRGIIGDLTSWPQRLADATERQLEYEAFLAWYTGSITVMDPKTGSTVAVSMGFTQATTYPTAGTIWSDAGVNAYQNLLTEIQNAENKMGPVGVVRSRRAVFREIIADAPDGPLGLAPTFASLEERVRAEGFGGITLVIDERTYDGWTDGGNATTAANYVPAGLMAFQPADGRVGNTHVAPVVRAYDFLTGGNRSLANGVVIFRSEKNEGKTLLIEAQQNAIVLPEEAKTYVVDTSVTS